MEVRVAMLPATYIPQRKSLWIGLEHTRMDQASDFGCLGFHCHGGALPIGCLFGHCVEGFLRPCHPLALFVQRNVCGRSNMTLMEF